MNCCSFMQHNAAALNLPTLSEARIRYVLRKPSSTWQSAAMALASDYLDGHRSAAPRSTDDYTTKGSPTQRLRFWLGRGKCAIYSILYISCDVSVKFLRLVMRLRSPTKIDPSVAWKLASPMVANLHPPPLKASSNPTLIECKIPGNP